MTSSVGALRKYAGAGHISKKSARMGLTCFIPFVRFSRMQVARSCQGSFLTNS